MHIQQLACWDVQYVFTIVANPRNCFISKETLHYSSLDRQSWKPLLYTLIRTGSIFYPTFFLNQDNYNTRRYTAWIWPIAKPAFGGNHVRFYICLRIHQCFLRYYPKLFLWHPGRDCVKTPRFYSHVTWLMFHISIEHNGSWRNNTTKGKEGVKACRTISLLSCRTKDY